MTVEFEILTATDRTIQLLALGHPIALRRFQYLQHTLKFAEVNDWSKIILQPNSQQAMTMLIKRLR